MLAAVRRSAKSWAAGAILLIALIAIVITGFGTGGFGGLGSLNTGAGGETLARAEGEQLTDREVNDIISRQFGQARQQQPNLSMTAFLAEVYQPIVDQLVLALAVDVFGRDQGLRVPDNIVDREIVGIQAFHDSAGRFDQAAFERVLAQQSISDTQLRRDIGRSLMQRQLLGPVARGAFVPQAIAREYASLMLERRRGTIAAIPAARLTGNIDPTPAEIANFYRQNRARFTVEERRVVRYAIIGPEQVAAAAQPSEAEIAAYYQQNRAAYGPRETRDFLQLPFPDQAAAQRFAAQVRGGTSFAPAAQALGFASTDIRAANQSREQFANLTSPEVAQAAFAAAEGSVVGPVRSALGFHVLRVERINRTPARPLEAVRGEITTLLAQRKRAAALEALVTRVEERLADGASVDEVARAERLTVATTPAVTEQGVAAGQAWTPPAGFAPLLRAAWEIDPEEPEPVIDTLDSGARFALVHVERVIPAAPPPLAQIREEVRRVLISRIALERSRRLAAQTVDRINGGQPAAAALAATRVATSRNVDMARHEVSQPGVEAPAPLLALFSIPEGRAFAMPAPDGSGWFVVHHAQRTPGDARRNASAIAEMRRVLAQSSPEEMAQQFARSLEQAVGIERDAAAIARTRQQLAGSAD